MSSSNVAPPKMMGTCGWRRLIALANAREATICWNTTEKPTSPYCDQSITSSAHSMKAGAASLRTAKRSSTGIRPRG